MDNTTGPGSLVGSVGIRAGRGGEGLEWCGKEESLVWVCK